MQERRENVINSEVRILITLTALAFCFSAGPGPGRAGKAPRLGGHSTASVKAA